MWSGECDRREGGIGGRGRGGESTSPPASSLKIFLHIVGLHVQSNESILNQVLNCVKWFLACTEKKERGV